MRCIEGRDHEPVNLVSLLEKELGKIRAVEEIWVAKQRWMNQSSVGRLEDATSSAAQTKIQRGQKTHPSCPVIPRETEASKGTVSHRKSWEQGETEG